MKMSNKNKFISGLLSVAMCPHDVANRSIRG